MRLDALSTTSVTVGTTSSISSSGVGAALVATRRLQQLHGGLVHRHADKVAGVRDGQSKVWLVCNNRCRSEALHRPGG